jgi:hypothetical protein
MTYFLAGLFFLLLFFAVALNVFGLPGNWFGLGLVLIWKWIHPEMDASWGFFLLLLAIAGVGELLEFGSQFWGAKNYGGSNKGSWGAFVGALIGAVLAAPVLMGLGALLGALLGAFVGALVVELLGSRPWSEAMQAAKGAMFGRVLGIVVKLGLGIVILALVVSRVWPV